ncbi:putative gustatory receptor 28a [Anopheles cruzii]|uniref:putative gustatory receptor 28a n=1 Tax=Anopheles cruzii TaxID=68878 RepID=UPI0022EC87FB|nr:putative gustatory receptor 28a [Anopheles cruzii]
MVISGLFFNKNLPNTVYWWYLLLSFANLVMVFLINMTINLLLIVLYCGEYIYRLINQRCVDLVHGSSQRHGAALQWYMLHMDTVTVVECLVDSVSKPLLLLNVWYFFIIVFSVFYLFTSIVQDMRREPNGYRFNMINPIAFFLSEASQVFYIVSAASSYAERAREIVPILGTYTVGPVEHSDERLFDLLVIQFLNRDYSVRVKGLYRIDYTMLFSIVSSTASYMIILVQYYLQE